MADTPPIAYRFVMIPAGYLLKCISAAPEWLKAAQVVDICSVSACVIDDVVDVQGAWLHNGFGLANDWRTLRGEAPPAEAGSPVMLVYCEVYEQEMESDGWSFDPADWRPVSDLPSAFVATAVEPPPPSAEIRLLGYDVVVSNDFLEHSPLSCNSMAAQLPANAHCLFDTLDAAKSAIDQGQFGCGCEDGIYRIMSVSQVLVD